MNIHVLDTLQLRRPGIVAATALETNEGLVLFDTGPESTFTAVSVALNKVGAKPADVRHVFLSHIHLDHAGSAWRFAQLGATVYVHPRGAPHLIDPSKLVESATRIFGEDMERLWGRVAPIPKEQVRIVEDGETLRVKPFEMRAIATPGHASHHHVYHWEDNVFGGDIAGVRLDQGPVVPPFVPPELHVESWLESIEKMRRLDANALYLPHFGRVRQSVATHLDELDERVRRWAEWFRERIKSGAEESELKARFAKQEHDELVGGGTTEQGAQDYEAADPSYMAVTAALRYWRKYHPEALA